MLFYTAVHAFQGDKIGRRSLVYGLIYGPPVAVNINAPPPSYFPLERGY